MLVLFVVFVLFWGCFLFCCCCFLVRGNTEGTIFFENVVFDISVCMFEFYEFMSGLILLIFKEFVV